MTSRVQTLRSSTSGNVPAAGTYAPGTMWTNFPDLQLGVIDATKTAQKLIAIRYFSTAANYVTGDVVVQAGAIYIAKGAVSAGAFNATQWTKIAQTTDIPAVYVLPTASTTVLGGVMVDGSTVKINSGVISASGLASVATTPPVSPQTGSQWFDLVGGQLYVYVDDGTSKQWVVAVNQSLGGVYLPMSGGILTGPLILNADPVQPLEAVTKQYSDTQRIGDNRIINGDMRIDQRNNGASGAAINVYTLDHWQYVATQAAKFVWKQYNSGPANLGFPYCLGFSSSSAYVLLAGDTFLIQQPIEADMVSDFAWETANAQPVTLSFLAESSLTGTFSGTIQNFASTRSYPFTFSLPTANVWTKIVILIPGDTGGTWVMSGNGGALVVRFDLGSGANNRGPAGIWASANYSGATGAANVVATNAAFFAVTGVKLEVGAVATPFNRQSLAKSMTDCQRYYQTINPSVRAFAAGAGYHYTSTVTFAWMRAAPTTGGGAGGTVTNISAATFTVINNNSAFYDITAAGAGDTLVLNAAYTLSAEL